MGKIVETAVINDYKIASKLKQQQNFDRLTYAVVSRVVQHISAGAGAAEGAVRVDTLSSDAGLCHDLTLIQVLRAGPAADTA